MQNKPHHFFLPGFRSPRKSQGEGAVGDCLFLLEQAVFKERKEVFLFSKFGLFPPFSPRYRVLFRDSFSPSDISASEIISQKA